MLTATHSSTDETAVLGRAAAARALGVCVDTLDDRLIKPGLIRVVRAGRRVLIPRSEITRLTEQPAPSDGAA